MNLILTRNYARGDGIFSTLTDSLGNEIAKTLEHSYSDGNGGFEPKIPPGQYNCVRGMHRLEKMTHDFETFEITGVDGHSNLLFHVGNFNKDSTGCVLVGGSLESDDSPCWVCHSRDAFYHFMKLQTVCNQFILTVIDNERPVA